ncbi:unnamed protein product [Trichogramma brassicae]|uniref:Uncharacterized protein n=1 Tax=Trichogramma brassicae TaxID=86971 RepID=A0A6H5I288_9HYME|nr:unnamed protein product [Trichogramma brassicae]
MNRFDQQPGESACVSRRVLEVSKRKIEFREHDKLPRDKNYSARLTRRLTRSKANEIIFKTKKYSGRHFEFCHDCVNLFSHTSSTRRRFRADSPGQRQMKSFSKTKKYSRPSLRVCHDCVNLLSHTSSTRRGLRADSPGQKVNEKFSKRRKYSGRHFEFCHDCVNLLSHTSSTRRGLTCRLTRSKE